MFRKYIDYILRKNFFRFSNLFESCQSLFWASFGMVGIESFELTGTSTYVIQMIKNDPFS